MPIFLCSCSRQVAEIYPYVNNTHGLVILLEPAQFVGNHLATLLLQRFFVYEAQRDLRSVCLSGRVTCQPESAGYGPKFRLLAVVRPGHARSDGRR